LYSFILTIFIITFINIYTASVSSSRYPSSYIFSDSIIVSICTKSPYLIQYKDCFHALIKSTFRPVLHPLLQTHSKLPLLRLALTFSYQFPSSFIDIIAVAFSISIQQSHHYKYKNKNLQRLHTSDHRVLLWYPFNIH